jgi:hypothetical protein
MVAMKENPSATTSNPRPKTRYGVTIEGDYFETSAYTEEQALSNAAYRYADQEDEEVKKIRWQVKSGELWSEVTEL